MLSLLAAGLLSHKAQITLKPLHKHWGGNMYAASTPQSTHLVGNQNVWHWLQGVDLSHDELLSFISESCTMSKALDEYEGRKSCAITTARRLAQFLGDERIKDKGLNCNYVIAKRPDNLPTSDRAIPVAIFSTEPSVARTYLRKWCGDVSGGDKLCAQRIVYMR